MFKSKKMGDGLIGQPTESTLAGSKRNLFHIKVLSFWVCLSHKSCLSRLSQLLIVPLTEPRGTNNPLIRDRSILAGAGVEEIIYWVARIFGQYEFFAVVYTEKSHKTRLGKRFSRHKNQCSFSSTAPAMAITAGPLFPIFLLLAAELYSTNTM